jgi:hypothetical protein
MMTKALEASDKMQKKVVVSVVNLGQVKTFDYHLIKRISETFTDGFPTRSSLCLIVKPPPLVGPFINVFKLFLKPKVRKRLHVVKSQSKLAKYADISLDELLASLDHDSWTKKISDEEKSCRAGR